MKPLPQAVSRYLENMAIGRPWSLSGDCRHDYVGAVVIPSLAEGESLFQTLESLAGNPVELLRRFLVVVVINHRIDASPQDLQQNREDLSRLGDHRAHSPDLQLAWVDAASPGLELASRDGGVGLARKLGFDLSLTRLDWSGQETILAGLDADTLVQPDYLGALRDHFSNQPGSAAWLPFRHQAGDDAAQQQAIDRYELFLRAYVLGLEYAGSPYAFHSVGSAMACTGQAYVRCGGMNRRSAGEDFYFLQQLAKTGGVARLDGTCVHPSARGSHRVPFGTGRSIKQQLAGDARSVQFYPTACFEILKSWLSLVSSGPDQEGCQLLAAAGSIDPELANYLDKLGFADIWTRLRRNHQAPDDLVEAFHVWFDGLKTLRLIHHLCDDSRARTGAMGALAKIFQQVGLDFANTEEELLQIVRRQQQPSQGQTLPGNRFSSDRKCVRMGKR